MKKIVTCRFLRIFVVLVPGITRLTTGTAPTRTATTALSVHVRRPPTRRLSSSPNTDVNIRISFGPLQSETFRVRWATTPIDAYPRPGANKVLYSIHFTRSRARRPRGEKKSFHPFVFLSASRPTHIPALPATFGVCI